MRLSLFTLTALLLLLLQTGCMYNVQDDPVGKTDELSGDGCVVLNYHRIRTPDLFTTTLAKVSNSAELNVYSVYTDDFKKQIQYLKQHHVQFVTADELKDYIARRKQIQGKCALLTFDDIDESVYQHAFPILKQERVPFVIFMLMGQVGKKYNHLQFASEKQLLEMKESGLAEIGLHTYNMHYLEEDEKPPFVKKENLKAFQEDTRKAEAAYEEMFAEKAKHYAYPFGYGIPETDLFLLGEGYQLIFSLQSGIVKPGDPSFFVKRVLIDPTSWKEVQKWVES